ncbi:MAG TPA: cytochrome c biogenesis protein CcsA [Blastocatellia bacterium]|jgi:ABC-type transport system involved in cytochrome c biogenesis permease subunit|nr:cytochrome c biogenesis protein CcsA [Blastocatellia bacterium]
MDILWIGILIGYAICVAQSIIALTTKRPVMTRTALASLAVAFAAQTVWLLVRGFQSGRPPLVGTQEMCAFLSWGLVLAYLIALRWYPTNALRAFVFPIVFVIATVAAFAPEASGEPEGLNDPLQRILLPVHAGLILLAYSSFFIAFGAGLMYIIQERELKHKKLGRMFYRLPSLDVCDAISFKAMAIGFILLTLGIAAGLVWSRTRDGQFFQGDPLEIFSVFTWLIYLLMIQSRFNARWGGRAAAFASIISFMIVVCSLVGVRYLGTLHVF